MRDVEFCKQQSPDRGVSIPSRNRTKLCDRGMRASILAGHARLTITVSSRLHSGHSTCACGSPTQQVECGQSISTSGIAGTSRAGWVRVRVV
jgi:hypothetical protein